MSSKLNFGKIIKEHFSTLKNDATGKLSLADIFYFYMFPLIIGGSVSFSEKGLSDNLISLAVNFGAITTALLMSVLVLVYDQEIKVMSRKKDDELHEDKYENKLFVLRELYQNICYTIVISIILVVTSFLYMLHGGSEFRSFEYLFEKFFSAVIVFLFVNIVFTMLMVIKRFHALLTH